MTSVQADHSERPVRPDKRNLMLDAAIHVFARTGYHAARVSDIACEAGIAYGLVYHYFTNKEEILNSIFEERWSGFLEAVESIADAKTFSRDKLEAVAALVLNAYRLRPEWVKVLVLEIQRSSRIAEPDQMRAVGRFFQIVARMLREGQEQGELRGDIDPAVAAYLFVGGLDLVITASVLEELHIEPGTEEAYYQKVAHSVAEIFLNGLAAERGTE
ncbi:MAG: TetR/AcrR family transcriptional regulator [Deltaproteobacteria bacterium]|nr:TetR/AcrR family transcriptional regulator [Deltaproteobacteria bacterium]